MAKNQNTFEKRRRDMEKKLRAEDKRKKRAKRKEDGGEEPKPTVVRTPQDAMNDVDV